MRLLNWMDKAFDYDYITADIGRGLDTFGFTDIAAVGIAHTPNFFNDLGNSFNEALEEQNSVGGCACCSCASQQADAKTILVELLDGFGLDRSFSSLSADLDFSGFFASFNFGIIEQASGGPDYTNIPGDTSSTSTIAVGAQVVEIINFNGDEDWFAVTLAAGQSYDISLIGTGPDPLSDPLLRILDSAGTELATNDDIILGDVRHSLLTFTATTAGTYFISAEAYTTQTGTYTLSLHTVADSTTNDVAETTATTANVVINGSVSGNIDSISDADWFEVTLTAGQRYLISQNGTGSNPLSNPFLRLYDASGTEIQSDDNSGPGSNARMAYVVETTGTYYISAEAFGATGGYGLTVQEVPNLEERDIDGIAHFLTDEFDTREAYATTTITYNITGLTAGAAILAERALQAWADVTPLTFTAVTTGGQIVFRDDGDGAFNSNTTTGGVISSSDLNVETSWNNGNVNLDSYTYQTFLHEIGHSLGLGHAGPYNGSATYNIDNAYLNDSWAYTVMSYFDQRESGYFGDIRLVLGPQIADIIAIQDLYGVNTTTRSGDTVYGFNSTEALTDVHNLDNPDLSNIPSMSIWDTGGIDTLDFSGYSVAQIINLGEETFSDINGISHVISIARGVTIENAVGGSGVDTITGNAVSNVLTGGGGNDILNGGAGTDYAVYSGNSINDYTVTENADGSFTVSHNGGGADGTDTLTGIEFLRINGTDTALSQSTPDFTEGADNFTGTAGDDVLHALGGDDTVRGAGGNDSIFGEAGNDRLFGDAGNDQLFGGGGDDSLTGGDGDDVMHGGDGNDTFSGQSGNDTLNGDAGDDRLFGGTGDDTINGGTGIDVLFGQDGMDTLNGDAGNDRLYGEGGDDTLDGGDGNDLLIGALGDDTLTGGLGNDTFSGQQGMDTLFGGAGDDRIYAGDDVDELHGGDGVDAMFGGNGDDVMYGDAGNDRLYGQNDDDTIFGGAGEDIVLGDAGNDTLNGGDDNDAIAGSIGNDILNGDAGNDRLFGGDGIDTMDGGTGTDSLFGQDGNDIMSGGDENDRLFGGNGNDTLNGDAGADLLFGEVGNDTVNGGDGIDEIAGQAGNDTLNGDAGNDRLFGGSGNDHLNGGSGNDTMFAQSGDNVLDGGTGNDRVYGAAGNDTYVFDTGNGGIDTFYNFTAGSAANDVINIAGGDAAFDTFAEVMAAATQSGSDTVIDFGGGNTITLRSVTLGDLTSADFTFGGTPGEAPDSKTVVSEVFELFTGLGSKADVSEDFSGLDLVATDQDLIADALIDPEDFVLTADMLATLNAHMLHFYEEGHKIEYYDTVDIL